MKKKLFTLFISLISLSLFAQEEHHSESHTTTGVKVHGREEAHGSLKHHRVALVWGHSYVPEGFTGSNEKKTLIVPSVGLDYEYWFSHKLAIGFSNDIELINYVIEDHEGEELEREYAYIGAIMIMYEFAHLWAIGVGPGLEVEKNENFAVFKATLEKEFPIRGKGGWDVTPVFSYELKQSGGHGAYNAFTLGISIGKRFK